MSAIKVKGQIVDVVSNRIFRGTVVVENGMISDVFEEDNNDGVMSGYSGNYIKVDRPWDPTLAGKIVEVTL